MMEEIQEQLSQRVESFDFAHDTPIRPDLSSDQFDWSVLLARKAHFLDCKGHFSLPAFAQDQLLIQIQHTTKVEALLRRPFQERLSGPGSVYVVPHGAPTEWHYRGCCDFVGLFLSPTFLAQVAVEATDTEPAVIELIDRVATQDPFIYQIGLEILQELEMPGPVGRLYVESLAHSLAIHLLRNHSVFPKQPLDPHGQLTWSLLRQAVDYINDNLGQDLSLAELAACVHLSPYHFARLFKRTIGLAPHQYVIRCRVKRAEQMLRQGELTIAEVAQQVGFSDHSHLNRHVKHLLGVTPKMLRGNSKNIQGNSKEIQD